MRREYPLTPAWRAFGVIAGLAFVAVGIGGLFGLADRPVAGALFCAGFVTVGVFALLAILRDRIVLEDDAIEHVELHRRRRVERARIRGVRWTRSQHGRVLVLERNDGAKPMQIAFVHRRDPALDAWLASLPDLDADDRRAFEAEVELDSSLGPTPEARREALASARTLSRAFHGVAVGVTFWAWIFPRPYALAVGLAALVPFVALALAATRPTLFALDGPRGSPRPILAAPILLPPLGLAMRSILDVSLVEHVPSIVAAVVLAGLLGLVAAGIARGARGAVLIAVMAGAIHGVAMFRLADAYFDGASAETFERPVLDRRVDRDRNHTSHYVRLAAWGPIETEDEYDVPRSVYDVLEIGDLACVDLHPGALGARWYAIRPCEP